MLTYDATASTPFLKSVFCLIALFLPIAVPPSEGSTPFGGVGLWVPQGASHTEEDHSKPSSRAMAQRLTVALLGDSISRGVLANMSLGDSAGLQDYLLVAQLTFGAQTVALLPENEGALNWKLMQQNSLLARDHLAAVQGNTDYGLKARLSRRGTQLDVINVAQLGGSYRTGEGQLALLQSETIARQKRGEPPVDVVIVDLGRIDFSFFTEPADFKSQVDSFFAKLRLVAPEAHILVTRISEIPRILDRPDRIGMYLVGGRTIKCSDVFRDKIATKTRLVPGADNSSHIGPALVRWETMNTIVGQKIAELAAQGVKALWVNTMPDRADPESWDEILASDCIHINETGQAKIADAYEQAMTQLFNLPTQGSSASESPAMMQLPVIAKDGGYSSVTHAAEESRALWLPEAERLWLEYTNSLRDQNLQKGCEPRLWKEQGPLRGSILLYHGFTACPQQYDELAALLSAEGYRVVVPVLPGHGRMWSLDAQGRKQDHFERLPQGVLGTPYDYRTEYFGLVDQMNRMFSHVQGPRAVVGLSVGASLATLGSVLRADIWDRQLILSPLYEVGQLTMRTLFGSIYNTQTKLKNLLRFWTPLLDTSVGWGEGCENERDPDYVARYGRSGIRAGICQFKLTHVAASNQIGYESWENIRPTLVKTQVIGVSHDILINKQLVFHAVGQMRNEKMGLRPFVTDERFDDHPNARVCYLPNDTKVCRENAAKPLDQQQKPCINHSLLSRFDSPEQNKYWIAPLNEKIVRFLVHGDFFPSALTEREHGDPLCQGF